MPKDSLDFGLRDFGAFWALEVDLGFLLLWRIYLGFFWIWVAKDFGLDSKCAVKVVLHA